MPTSAPGSSTPSASVRECTAAPIPQSRLRGAHCAAGVVRRRPLRRTCGNASQQRLPSTFAVVDAHPIQRAAHHFAGIAALVFTPWIPKALAKPELAKNAVQLGIVAVRVW